MQIHLEDMTDTSSKSRPLLPKDSIDETTGLLSSSQTTKKRDRFDSELSLSRLAEDDTNGHRTSNTTNATYQSSKNLNHSIIDDDELENDNNDNTALIRSLSPVNINNDAFDSQIMDVNMVVKLDGSVNTAMTEITEDDSQFYRTQGIYNVAS